MSGPGPDEKVCPYCAEVIKAAAIKCRYCQSELSAEPAEPAEPREEKPAQARGRAPGVEEQEPITAEKATSRESTPLGFWSLAGSLATTATLLVLVLGLALAAFLVNRSAGDNGTDSAGQVVDGQVRAVALTQGSTLVQDALSYSYKDFDKVRQANESKMTAVFRKKYAVAMDKAATNTKKYDVTLKTTVVAGGIQSITATEAKILLFVNQVTAAEKGPDKTPTTQINRTVVTLVRSDGDWRIGDIDTLSGDAGAVTTK